jgi:hypothetical protein
VSAIHTIVSQGQESLFRLKSGRSYGIDRSAESLSDKLNSAGLALKIDPEAQRIASATVAAFEEARRIQNPKAQAEARMERAERRLEEIRREVRFAVASGDRDKLVQLSREAALAAREAGKAASEYGTGISNAAAMNKGGSSGDENTGNESQTTLTIQQTEVDVSLTVTSDGDTATAPPSTAAAPPPEAMPPGQDNGIPSESGEEDFRSLIDQASDLLGQVAEGSEDRPGLSVMFADNDRANARWKEADGFGRRVERLLAQCRAVITEAKRSNDTDMDIARRRARRKALEADDASVSEAQLAVNDLRAAAYGGGTDLAQALASAVMAATEGASAAPVVTPQTPPPVVNLLA